MAKRRRKPKDMRKVKYPETSDRALPIAETHYYENQRLMHDTRWTPNDEHLRELLRVAVREAESVLQLSQILGIKYRQLRRYVNGESKAISYNVVDKILIRSSVADEIRNLPWYTVTELVELGIWQPQWGNPLPEDEDDDE